MSGAEAKVSSETKKGHIACFYTAHHNLQAGRGIPAPQHEGPTSSQGQPGTSRTGNLQTIAPHS